jgi:hypothetical protein
MSPAEILQNSAPAIGGLFVAAAALTYVHMLRRARIRTRQRAREQAHHPAEWAGDAEAVRILDTNRGRSRR